MDFEKPESSAWQRSAVKSRDVSMRPLASSETDPQLGSDKSIRRPSGSAVKQVSACHSGALRRGRSRSPQPPFALRSGVFSCLLRDPRWRCVLSLLSATRRLSGSNPPSSLPVGTAALPTGPGSGLLDSRAPGARSGTRPHWPLTRCACLEHPFKREYPKTRDRRSRPERIETNTRRHQSLKTVRSGLGHPNTSPERPNAPYRAIYPHTGPSEAEEPSTGSLFY